MRSLAFATLVWLAAAPAAAQDILVTVTALTGRAVVDLADLSSVTRAPLTRAECEAGASISFQFTMIDQARAQLHLFHGSNCNDSSIRNDTTDMSCTDLFLEYAISTRTQVDQDIPVSSLIDCSSTSSGQRTVWVLALDEPVSEVTGAGQQTSFPLAFDFEGPAAPTGFTARDGETAATLSWDGSTDEITVYEVYFVENGCDGMGTVTTTAFADPDNPTVAVDHVVSGTETGTTVSLVGFGTGSQHAVAVRAVDNAGNTGPLSTPVCVTKIDVNTFWDAYCGTGGAGGTGGHPACTGTGCSATPAARDRTPFGLALFALGVLAWRRRSRT